MAHSSKFPVITLVTSGRLPRFAGSLLESPTFERSSSGALALTEVLRVPGDSSPSSGSAPLTHQDGDGMPNREWLRCMVIDCEAEAAKRRIVSGNRFDRERLQWLEAADKLTALRYWDPNAHQLHEPLPVLNPAPALLPHEETYRKWKRPVLVNHLLNEGAAYGITNRKLLSHISVDKLARRLAEVRLANVEAARA